MSSSADSGRGELVPSSSSETGLSPVRLSLHVGELPPSYTPSGWDLGESDHITRAVERARADRLQHELERCFRLFEAGR